MKDASRCWRFFAGRYESEAHVNEARIESACEIGAMFCIEAAMTQLGQSRRYGDVRCWLANRRHHSPGSSRPSGNVIRIKLCLSKGCREIWPFPCVSSTRTELPADTRRTSPSLVSNSTMPSSHTASTRPGGVCHLLREHRPERARSG